MKRPQSEIEVLMIYHEERARLASNAAKGYDGQGRPLPGRVGKARGKGRRRGR